MQSGMNSGLQTLCILLDLVDMLLECLQHSGLRGSFTAKGTGKGSGRQNSALQGSSPSLGSWQQGPQDPGLCPRATAARRVLFPFTAALCLSFR